MLSRIPVLVAAVVATTPSAYAVDRAAGLSCGMNASTDPTGLVFQDPNTYVGTVFAGPVLVANTTVGVVADVTIRCTLQINDGRHGGGGPTRSRTTPGPVGALADTLSFQALPGDTLYLCMHVAWNSTKGHTDWYLDADGNPANGLHCTPGGPVAAQQPIAY